MRGSGEHNSGEVSCTTIGCETTGLRAVAAVAFASVVAVSVVDRDCPTVVCCCISHNGGLPTSVSTPTVTLSAVQPTVDFGGAVFEGVRRLAASEIAIMADGMRPLSSVSTAHSTCRHRGPARVDCRWSHLSACHSAGRQHGTIDIRSHCTERCYKEYQRLHASAADDSGSNTTRLYSPHGGGASTAVTLQSSS